MLKKINLLTLQPFFVGKWIGGYLTNFDKINQGNIIEKKISCLIILDPNNSLIAIQEAILLNIPIICFFDDNFIKENRLCINFKCDAACIILIKDDILLLNDLKTRIKQQINMNTLK